MEYIKQEIQVELKDEEISSTDLMREESSETHQLEAQKNMLTKYVKIEVIKLEDDQFLANPLSADVRSVKESIPSDFLKAESSRHYFKTEMIKTEVLKPLIIKLERIDEKFCVDGMKVCKNDNSFNNENIIYTFPMKTSNKSLINKNSNDMDKESDFETLNNSMELSLNERCVKDAERLTVSSSGKNKKKYARPLKFVRTVCNKGFTDVAAQKDHIKIHTAEQSCFCNYCDKSFRTKTLLKLHLQLHTGKRHKCTECSMSFTQVGPFNNHMRTHYGEKPFQCSKCEVKFSSKRSLIKHFKKKCFSSLFVEEQNINEYFTCDVCNKEFKQKDFLSCHIRRIHLREKPFPCRICGLVKFSVSNRKSHEKLHSENKFCFFCAKCNKGFEEKTQLKFHLKYTHSETKPFTCNLCNASFKVKTNLRVHTEVHHTEKNPNKYVCDICKRGFYRLLYLKRHQMTHTGSDRTFSCDKCEIKCRSKNDMERHILTHIGGGDKPFKCNLCEMAFSRRNKLERHMIVHSDVKPFKCDLCSKAYKDSCSLRIHKGSLHLKKKFICNECGFKSTNESSFKRHVRHKQCKIKTTTSKKVALQVISLICRGYFGFNNK